MGEWTDVYEGVTNTEADHEMMPVQGVRMLQGIDSHGQNVFFVKIDGAEDNVMTCFLLDLAADTIRRQARSTYMGITSKDFP